MKISPTAVITTVIFFNLCPRWEPPFNTDGLIDRRFSNEWKFGELARIRADCAANNEAASQIFSYLGFIFFPSRNVWIYD